MRKTKTSKEEKKMYQMKHREDLGDIMDSFGVMVREIILARTFAKNAKKPGTAEYAELQAIRESCLVRIPKYPPLIASRAKQSNGAR